MKKLPPPLDLKRVRVYPVAERLSEANIDEILVDPDSVPPAPGQNLLPMLRDCAKKIAAAHSKQASVMLLYGAHLIKNGGGAIMNRLMESGWVTHLATNGAGTIHDWEFAHLG